MLNLFRCSSAGDKLKENDIHFFVTDYFDGIKVEELSSETTTLAECMGIKKKANKEHAGISHQRYCLYSEAEQDNDIFNFNLDLPILTVIQVFINPDIYQSDNFMEDGKEVSCSNCIKRMEECIQEEFKETANLQWQVYRLLTAGDFAVIVRSRNIHDAYDITTLIRNIHIIPERTDKRVAVFFTYSIAGIPNINNYNTCGPINWNEYLNKEDRVIVRIVYSQSGKEGNKIEEQSLTFGHRLLGRYDFQQEYSSSEFQELYPYIRDYKFGEGKITEEILNAVSADKTKSLLKMIKTGQVLRINEKILLYYESESLLKESSKYVWKVSNEKEWISLYEKNAQTLLKIKDLVTKELEDKDNENNIEKFYPRERNLKEYVRLLGRFCRVLYEINQMRELRISTANLTRQLAIMLESLLDYIKNARINKCDILETANRIDEYLHLGIGSLEIFARYIRNINLQTLQTPNYDLQTNMCIEKILLSYSQFLQPFLVKQKSDIDNKRPYYLSNTLYPIVVPNMGVKDMSVCVLFDDYHLEDKILKDETHDKLMVVNSPTFSYLCETCFLLPTAFHEIAHQFRYESHEERNACLEAFLLKEFIYIVVFELMEKEYEFQAEKELEKVVDAVYQKIKGQIVSDKIKKGGFQLFKLNFEMEMQKFLASVNEQQSPAYIISQYLEKTKGDVRYFDENILWLIERIEEEIEKAQSCFRKDNIYDTEILIQLFKEYFLMQEKQILEEIEGILIKIKAERKSAGKWLAEDLEKFCLEIWKDIPREEKGRELFKLWENLEENSLDFVMREDLKNLLKHYHNLYNTFSYTEDICETEPDQLEQEIRYQNVFKNMCTAMYEELLHLLNELERERNEQLKWDTMLIKNEKLEYIKRKIKFEKKEGMEKRLKSIFSHYQDSRIREFITSQMEYYIEVTSDIFMCSMMGLEIFGYLVVAAENFVFNNENELMLYKRMSLVLQCLSKERAGENLTTEIFSNELLDTLRREINILKRQCPYTSYKHDIGDNWEEEIDSIVYFLKEMRKRSDLTTTQDWILRMLLQISYIIYNIKDTIVASEIIGEKEVWKDIVSENSYITKKEMLVEQLKDKEGTTLLNSIANILNSPASYFASKKYLLTEEIEFVLYYYEKNCKEIFK